MMGEEKGIEGEKANHANETRRLSQHAKQWVDGTRLKHCPFGRNVDCLVEMSALSLQAIPMAIYLLSCRINRKRGDRKSGT